VVVYRADESVAVLHIADAISGKNVLPGLVLPLAALFVDD